MKVTKTVGAVVIAIACLLLLGACSAMVKGRSVTVTGPTEPTGPVTPEYPIAPELVGEPPVGYWVCVDVFDVERLRTSNSAFAPRLEHCRRGWADGTEYGIEIRPDGAGYDLEVRVDSPHIPTESFVLEGVVGVFTRDDEFRWQLLDDGRIHYQTTSNYYYNLTVVGDDRLRVDRRGNSTWMLRMGTPVVNRVYEFRECVANNRGKPLFEVVDCGDPFAAT